MYKKAATLGFSIVFGMLLLLACYFYFSFQKNYILSAKSYQKEKPALHFEQNTKTFFSFDEGEYKQARFESEQSIIERKSGKWQEYLTNLTGIIQTKLYTTKISNQPMQQIYGFSSKSGKYDYKKNRLYAPICSFTFFYEKGKTLPLHIPNDDAFLHGIAKWTTFSIKPQLKFAADRLKMIINKDNEQRKIK